jgi:flavin reductase (DIM6/NTAB) family NADH-FMN oxidoreductase RutF
MFRDALGNFATGVCVITAAAEQGAPIGMTVNSFASVSLEPPLVLWSIQKNSECFDLFNTVDQFAINILSAEQEEHSRRYSKKGQHELSASHYFLGQSGNPILIKALTNLECCVWARYPGGDHLIIVGEVLAFSIRPTGHPLLFSKGKYAQLQQTAELLPS